MTVTIFDFDYEVDTPFGRGNVLCMTNYGFNGATTFTITLNENGAHVEVLMSKTFATKNYTFGRGEDSELKEIISNAKLTK